MTDQGRGQQLIVGCLTASLAVAAGSAIADDRQPGFRLVVGGAAVAATLATVNMFAPDLSGGMAILVLTTTVFVYGGPLFDVLAAYLGKSTAARRSSTVRSSNNPKGSVSI